MYAFTHHTAVTIADAVAALGEGKYLAGGQTLLPTMKQRLAMPGHLVDLGRVAELKGVVETPDALIIKAMTTHADVARSPCVAGATPGLEKLAGRIGDPAVRHRGTIGGSLANNDPTADYPAACLALKATIVTDKRRIPADQYFMGLFTTALDDTELITAVEFPKATLHYAKFPNPASRYAMVGVAIVKHADGVRVAVTGSGADGVFRWRAAEERLSDAFNAAALDGLKPDERTMMSDIHGQADYRAHLVGVMARRALPTG